MSDSTRPALTFQSFERPEFWTGNYVTFAAEVGYVTWAWNALHADLCDLFWTITGIDAPYVPRSIWNAIKSDTGQRAILEAAARARLSKDKDAEVLAEVIWLLREVDQIAAFRNDAFHTLWTIRWGDSREIGSWHAIPDCERGNPRGKRLAGKPAGEVFKMLAGHCMTLVQFARFLDERISGRSDDEPLPERPARPAILQT